MNALQVIELFAGVGADGNAVVERLQVKVNEEDDTLQLVKSPAFAKGLASGDTIRWQANTREFSVVKRSGNLCIRVFARNNIAALSEALSPVLEKLGGELDIENERMLVYSIHVSCGFAEIEKVLNNHVQKHGEAAWLYGNVYDPEDGQTLLNWWVDMLKPE